MPRIRTIKPEIVESQNLGLISRDARLLFILIWTVADDEGRGRSHPKLLARTLFPYDDNVEKLVAVWLKELERVGSIHLYNIDGNDLFEIPKWKEHQKIDRPSASKFPPYSDYSRDLFDNSTNDRRAYPVGMDLRTGTSTGNGNGTKEGNSTSPPEPIAFTTSELQEAVTTYNEVAEGGGLPRCQRLTEPRKAALRNRLEECGGLAGWANAMAKVRDSPFLTGRTDKPFKADIDFVLQQKSFTKLMEGSYDDRGHSKPKQSATADEFDRIAARARSRDVDT